MSERDQLAGFHRVISEQLNARLAESPRFFWVLVVASAGYGYVLWNLKSDAAQQSQRDIVVTLASFLTYVAILWANWYLAALGYAFRFLQNCQHCIEHALRWDEYTPTGAPVEGERRRRAGELPDGNSLCDSFWLLPGIYHAHVFGLSAFLFIVGAAFCWNSWRNRLAVVLGLFFLLAGVAFTFGINRYYLRKFKAIRRDPNRVTVLPP
jgi:hypothetical protein